MTEKPRPVFDADEWPALSYALADRVYDPAMLGFARRAAERKYGSAECAEHGYKAQEEFWAFVSTRESAARAALLDAVEAELLKNMGVYRGCRRAVAEHTLLGVIQCVRASLGIEKPPARGGSSG